METINLNPAPAPVAAPAPASPQVVVVSNSKGGNTIYIVIIAILLIMGGVYFVMNRRPPVPDDLPVPVGPTPDQIAPVEPEGDENIEVEALDDTAETKEKEVEFATGTQPPVETKEKEVKFVTSAPPPPTEPSEPSEPSEPAAKSSLDDLKPEIEFITTTTKEPTEESTMLNIRERVIFATPAKNEKAVEEIRMGIAQGVVEQIQQVGGVTQGIQQVGGGVSQGIQQVEKKKGSPFQNNANKAVARLDGLMAGGGNSNSKAERRKEITDARNEAEQAIAHAVETGGYNPYDGTTNLPTKAQLMREPKPKNKSKMNIQQIPKKKGVVQEIQQVGMVKGFL